MRRPCSRGLCSNSSTVSRTTWARSTHSSASGSAPSARASASSRSASRASRASAATSGVGPILQCRAFRHRRQQLRLGQRGGDRRADLVCAVVGETPLGLERVREPPEQPLVASTAGLISVTTPSSGSNPSACGSCRDTAPAVRWTCCTSERDARNTMYAANASSAASGTVSHSSGGDEGFAALGERVGELNEASDCPGRRPSRHANRRRRRTPSLQGNVEELGRRILGPQLHAPGCVADLVDEPLVGRSGDGRRLVPPSTAAVISRSSVYLTTDIRIAALSCSSSSDFSSISRLSTIALPTTPASQSSVNPTSRLRVERLGHRAGAFQRHSPASRSTAPAVPHW